MTDDNTPTPAPAPAPAGTEPAPGEAPKNGDEPLGEAGQKALQAERARAAAAEKSARDLQRKLDEATSSRAAAETAREDFASKLSAAEQRALRMEIAYEKGVPRDAIDFLPQTGDQEALSAAADKLLGLVASRPTTPRPDPSQGARTPAPVGARAQFEQWAKNL